MKTYTEEATITAQTYYNSNDADNFYFTIWGGEDIHVGLYKSDDEPIAPASQRTIERMAGKAPELNPDSHVLDLGAGYGGSCRYLVRNLGCWAVALNLSEVENERDRQKNREQGLENRIEVIDASFEEIPYEDESFSLVWSQDAFLHSGDRHRIFEEIARVLEPGGRLVFTDPMRTDDCPDGVLDPILARLNLDDLACPALYREFARELGLEEVEFEEHADQLPRHYQRVLDETIKGETRLKEAGVSDDYIQKMKTGLGHWVDGGRKGYLTWGIFNFRKQ